jgi:tetratricopeptide (TPR) repeat protein
LVFAAVALALVGGTVKRNEDFRSATSIWTDTVAKRPANARAQCYLGDALAAEGRWTDALGHYDEAIRLDRPALARGDRSIYGDILVNSGNVLRALGRNDEAAQRYEEALRLDANLLAAHFNLGAVHLQANRLPAAIEELTQALKLDPNYTAAHTSLGSALLLAGRSDEALSHYAAALQLDPSAKSQRDLGIALLYLKRLPAAIEHLEEAVRLAPASAPAHEFLAGALVAQGRKAEAVAHYQRALQLEPDNERVRRTLESLSAPPH